MSPSLILPRRLAAELADKRDSFRADVYASLDLTDTDGLMAEYCRKLQAFDRRLMLVRAAETVVPGVPMRPGFYHLLIDNGPEVPLTVTVIEGEHGEWTEPTSRIFEKLMSGDIREERNRARFERNARAEFEANEREQQQSRDERREHLRDLVNAYTRTGVSMTDAVPWRQNQAGHSRGG